MWWYINQRSCSAFWLGFRFVPKDSRSSDVPDGTKNTLAGKLHCFLSRELKKAKNPSMQKEVAEVLVRQPVAYNLRVVFSCCAVCCVRTDHYVKHDREQILMLYSETVIIVFRF